MNEPKDTPAAAYAAALRKAVASYTAAPGKTQDAMAKALHVSPSSLSRYLKGERTAPRETLRAIQAFLEAQGLPLPAEASEELDALCSQAHLASGSPAVQLAQLKEELTRLRGEQQQAQQVAEERLTGLEEQAARLAEQLEVALARAQTAEGAREILQARVTEQDESLRHAQDYTHQIEAELTQQKEQARLLLQEVGVLRQQNRELVEEQHRVPAPSTQDTSMDATLAARRARVAAAEKNLKAAAPPQDPRHPLLNPYDERTPPRTRTVYTRSPPPKNEQYTPGRDTLSVLALTAVIGLLGLIFSGGMQATPGPAIWKLAVTAFVTLVASVASLGLSASIAAKYSDNGWTTEWPLILVTLAAIATLIAAIGAPFLLDSLGQWLGSLELLG
ncbi:helix-turn-helix domain-containing protein [Streptomyces sp. NPDC051366]|uniref:helix-turn-helix domain-containing protein n=1 Tax=Streptomyces sp. NPDC051366 TaxID=3365652 RepID=UPI0037B81313